jgi:hypothetical protein
LEEVVFEEIPLWVCGMYAPPIVGEDIEDAEDDDKEGSGPLGLETNGNHDAGNEPNNGDEHTRDAPFTLDDETQEEENQEDTTGKKNTWQ